MVEALDLPVSYPPLALCTDNAAMIAAAGHWAWSAGRRDTLAFDVVPSLALGD
jgi:N6-L-threonylcarbamoyladenine synthase